MMKIQKVSNKIFEENKVAVCKGLVMDGWGVHSCSVVGLMGKFGEWQQKNQQWQWVRILEIVPEGEDENGENGGSGGKY